MRATLAPAPAPAPSFAPAPAAAPAGVRRPWVAKEGAGVGVAIGFITVAGLALLAIQLSQPGYLFGVTEYDDAVYFGAAVRLVHGALPYHDYVFQQPPGIALLLSPIGLLSRLIGTRDGLAVARVLTVLVGGANIALLGRLLRHRGLPAALVGCAALAAFPATIRSAHTVLLEPYLVLACLVGAIIAFEGDELAEGRRLAWAGVVFGLAGAVKLWAIFPVLVIAALCLPDVRRRLVPFVGGVAAGFVVPCAPFFLVAPGRFVTETITDQLSRLVVSPVPVLARLEVLTGMGGSGIPLTAAATAGVVLVLAAFMAGSFVATRLGLSRLESFVLGTGSLVMLAFLVAGQFFGHYAAFFALFLAALLGLAAARWRLTSPVGPMGTALAAVVLGGAIFASGASFLERDYSSGVDPGLVIQRSVPAGACVVTDLTSETITANRLVANSPRCPLLLDGAGTDRVLGGNQDALPRDTSAPAVGRAWLSYLERAQYVVLSSPRTQQIPWTPQIQAYSAAHFVRVKALGVYLYRRTS
ncbi:MAG: glycosyltransferase 87 family protein [Acidimicrobiales bacterium]